MSELTFDDQAGTLISIVSANENIAERRTIVYQTLMDATTAKIEGEKNKNKLFNRFLFKLNTPEDIEFVSIEKYYEPYIVVSGKHLIEYYRKSAYTVNVDKEAKEVVLFDRTFTPRPSSFSSGSDGNIRLEGEERIAKETRGFLILDRYGQDTKLEQFPSAPSEDNPQKLIKSFNMPAVSTDIDLEAIRRKIVKHPYDISRILNEELEVDERSVIYAPRFRLTYRCPRIGKEAYLEFDGVTLKKVKQGENVIVAKIGGALSTLKRLVGVSTKWLMKTGSAALERGKLLAEVN